MRIYCIADEDTVRGFRLAGVEGEAVANAAEAAAAVERAVGREETEIVLLTDVIAAEIRPLVDSIRLGRERPLIAEIPGPDGPLPGRKTLLNFVQEAVGIRVGQEDMR